MPPNKEQRERLKEWLKPPKDFRNTTPDIIKPFDNRGALREHYVGGRVALHVHVGFGQNRGKRCAKDLCAEFEALVGRNDEVLDADGVQNTVRQKKLIGGNQDWIYHPVFVRVRQRLQNGEFVTLRIRSLVRLKFMDDCPMVGEHVLEGTSVRKLFRDDIRAWGVDLYGKPNLASPPLGGRSSTVGFVTGELPNNMVQDTTEVVDNVANQDTEVAQREIRDCYSPKDMVARLRVELTDDSYLIGLSQKQGADFGIKRVSMYPRPINLGPTSTEVGLADHDHYKGGVMASKRNKLP
jgi:hypothetical protein